MNGKCFAAIIRWGQTGNQGYLPNDVMPGTFMAVATDLGDGTVDEEPQAYGHSRYKREMGQRLAAAAMNVVYGRKEEYCMGPIAGIDDERYRFMIAVWHCIVIEH